MAGLHTGGQPQTGGASGSGSPPSRGVIAPAFGQRKTVGAATAGGADNGDAVRRAIQEALGQSGGAGPNASAAGPTTNTAAPNPTSQAAIDAMMKRAQGDMGAGAALDAGIQDIRARASMGIAGEQEASRAMRGMSAGSAADTDAQGLARSSQAQINGLTTDITLGRERDRDQLYQAAGNMGLATGDQQLRAMAGAREQHRDDRQAAYDARNAYMQNFSTVLSLLSRKSAVV